MRTMSLSDAILNHTQPGLGKGAAGAVFLKCDVEGAEYDLLPHLLMTGALCRVTHLYMEWHLNIVSPERRLAALALRTALEHMLKSGCAQPPVWVEHDESRSAGLKIGGAPRGGLPPLHAPAPRRDPAGRVGSFPAGR